MTKKSLHCAVEKCGGARATKIEEFKPHPRLLLPIFNEQFFKHLAGSLHAFGLLQPSPRLDELSVVRSDEEDVLRVGIEKRTTKPLQQFLLIRLPFCALLGS